MCKHLTSLALSTIAIPALLAGCEPTAHDENGAVHAGGKWESHTQGLPFILGFEEGQAAMRSSGKPGMMFVTTTWCGWCKKLAHDNFRDPAVRSMLENFVLVIVDGDTEGVAARKLGANGFPHVVFQSSDGTTLATVRGYRPLAEFKPVVESVLKKTR